MAMSSNVDLPYGVIEDILTRLPTKDVGRCKLLSKTYNALIESPRFINKHRHRSSTNSSRIILTGNKRLEDGRCFNYLVSLVPCQPPSVVYVPPSFKYASLVNLVGSCNGLLCAQFTAPDNMRSFLLWNPATRDHMILPPPKFDGYDAPGFGYDAPGFGYDATCDDYKLVIVAYANSRIHVQLWTMSTNSWRKLEIAQVFLFEKECMPTDFAALVRGNLYWVQEDSGSYILFSFDMATDCFSSQKILPDFAVQGYSPAVIDFMGALAVCVQFPDPCKGFKFEIWVRMDDNSWTKQFTIRPFSVDILPMRIVTDGKILMCRIIVGNSVTRSVTYEYFWYDLQTKKRMKLRSLSFPPYPWSSTESFVRIVNRRGG